MKDLKKKVVRGGLAKIASQAVFFTIRLGSVVVLARLLDPKDFGLVAMVTAITGVLSLFKDAGLSMATIQRESISHAEMSAMFWVNVLVGVTLAALLMAMAPALSAFYQEPRLYWVAMALTADFLFVGISAQHSALLQRQMRFGVISAIEIITQVTGISVAIVLAVKGWGYWALVGQAVAMQGISALFTWLTARWVPSLPSRKVGIRSMVRFGGLVTLNNLVVYIAYNFEKILLGRYWGADALGIYGRAYQLINIPTENINSTVFGIAFSALSRIQDDTERQKKYFLKGYALLLSLTLPITIACAVFAEDMIFVLLGAKWMAAAPIFRLLAPTILIFAMINPFAWLLYSTGRAGRSLKLAFVIAPLVIGAYVIGLPYGPKGVALAYSTALSLWVIPHIAWCIHGTGISGLDILQTITRPLVSGLVAAAIAFGVRHNFDRMISEMARVAMEFNLPPINPTLYPYLQLFVEGSAMLISYFLMLLYVMGQKAIYVDIFKLLRNRTQAENDQPAQL